MGPRMQKVGRKRCFKGSVTCHEECEAVHGAVSWDIQRDSECAAASQSVSGQFTLTNQRTSSLQRNRDCSNGVDGGKGGHRGRSSTEIQLSQGLIKSTFYKPLLSR
jgi:hypothetical protein